MLRNALGSGGVRFPRKKRYEGVRFNVISITRWLVGVIFPEKKCYVRMSALMQNPDPPSLMISVIIFR